MKALTIILLAALAGCAAASAAPRRALHGATLFPGKGQTVSLVAGGGGLSGDVLTVQRQPDPPAGSASLGKGKGAAYHIPQITVASPKWTAPTFAVSYPTTIGGKGRAIDLSGKIILPNPNAPKKPSPKLDKNALIEGLRPNLTGRRRRSSA